MTDALDKNRTISLFGATGIGVGAIVGGGILAMAGTALTATGPGALAAFTLNGIIALLTVLTFAELSVLFPQSGGTYTFSKKVLSVETAFAVGWVVWFASIVAAVLYALGFASFALAAAATLYSSFFGHAPLWSTSPWMKNILAILSCCFYMLILIRSSRGGGQWVNIGKVVVFTILIIGGFAAISSMDPSTTAKKFTPFFPMGLHGLISAMGYTFIALQGFDLIAAVAGEIKDPGRIIPRAMLLSLSIAMVIYLPLLAVVIAAGTGPGESIMVLSAQNPATIIAVAAQRYLGQPGYWLVMAAGILSMLSALQANIFAASRVAQAMAKDRNLFRFLEKNSPRFSTPVAAILATGAIVIIILSIVPDVAAAGAASSLIFLITFALAHVIGYLARSRAGDRNKGFKAPFFPFVPLIGGTACISLAIFQGINVPSAGLITSAWLISGAILFLIRFARHARIVDAANEAIDPELLRLRGRAPLVLVPIANPASAGGLIALAGELAPVNIGRVLLLSVVTSTKNEQPDQVPRQLIDAQAVLEESLMASFHHKLVPEVLTTIADDPFQEIIRVARDYRCASVLLGFTKVIEKIQGGNLERLISAIDSDMVILRTRPGWTMHGVKRILVPVGGKGSQDPLRSRLLSSFYRDNPMSCEIIFLMILPENLPEDVINRRRRRLESLAREEIPAPALICVVQSAQVVPTIIEQSEQADLLVLGLQRLGRHKKLFGKITAEILRRTTCPVIMISHKG